MKIGIFLETYEPFISGVTTSVKMLVDTYKSMGHEVYIVTANLENRHLDYQEDKKILYLPSIKTKIYDLRISGIYSFKAMSIIKKWDLDVIHSHTEFGVGTFSRIVRKSLHIPLVHTYHTQYEDYVHYITRGLFDGLGKKIVALIAKFYGDKTLDALIVPTQKIKDIFRTKYNVKRKIHVVPTGIDTEQFVLNDEMALNTLKIKAKFGFKEDDFIIGPVGRIAREKSLDFLVNQMITVLKHNPKVKLLIIGYGPEENNLKNLVKKLDLEKSVFFTGKVEYDKIANYYNTLNALVTASTTETQGLTVIEALAASKPVVCINDTSFTKTIIDGYNGLIFKNELEYISAIKKISTNDHLYETMCHNARNSVYRYSKEAYASEVLKIYAGVTKKDS